MYSPANVRKYFSDMFGSSSSSSIILKLTYTPETFFMQFLTQVSIGFVIYCNYLLVMQF